jgi:hypothetical protein
MRHVEQCAGCVALHTHVFRFGEPGQRLQGTRSRYLGLVVLVRCEIRNASDGVALHLDVGRVHLLDQGRQPPQRDDGDLVLGYCWSAEVHGTFCVVTYY